MSDGQKTRRVIFWGFVTAVLFFSMLASAPFGVLIDFAGLFIRSPES
jgi:hypothetical protein